MMIMIVILIMSCDYCMMKGSKKPLAAMLDTSVMCRPDNLVMMVMESRADNLVKDNLNAAKWSIDKDSFYIEQKIVRTNL